MDTLQYTNEGNSSKKSSLINLIEWAFRFVALFCVFYSIYLLALRDQYWVISLGYVSSVTLGCVGAIILLSEYSFSRHQQMGAINSMVFSVLFAAAFVWTYELIYYLSFPGSLDFNFTAAVISQIGGTLRTVAVDLLYILPIVLLRKKLAIGRSSLVLLAIFSALWIVWILYGFPQYYLANYLTHSIYPKVFVAADPYRFSLFFNYTSKAVLGVFFISLLKVPYREDFRALVTRISLRERVYTRTR